MLSVKRRKLLQFALSAFLSRTELINNSCPPDNPYSGSTNPETVFVQVGAVFQLGNYRKQ